MATETNEVDDQICYSCQEERSWWRVWTAIGLTMMVISFGALTAYKMGFAAGVNAARAVNRGDDEHKASGCGQDSCPCFVPQDPEPPNYKVTL